MATLLIKKIPEKLLREYKAACAKQGITQQADIIEYLKSKSRRG